jgi:uncharacterized protein (TIGR03435 family)
VRIFASIALIALAGLVAAAAFAQRGDATPKFDTAEIRLSAPNTILSMRKRFFRGRYELRNASLVDLIRTAWDVDADNVVGGPDWLDLKRFDVIATAPADSGPETLRAMLRQLLADRFQLAVHQGIKDFPSYAMTVRRKVQIKQASATSEDARCRANENQTPAEPVLIDCHAITMAAFAKAIPGMRGASGYLYNYPVVDRTGLSGVWDFSVKWSPRTPFFPSAPGSDTFTIFDAFEKQLGLNLKLTAVPLPVVVVDHVNPRPSGNQPGISEAPPARPQFEVATIKPDDPDRQGSSVGILPGGRVNIRMTVKGLIQEAWGDMNPHRVVGVPNSMDTTRFEVVAKAATEEGAVTGWNGPVWNGVDLDSMRMMLRSLLVDRFGLVTHDEDRLVFGYALVASRPGLRRANASNRPGCKEGPGADGRDPRLANPMASRLVTCRNMTLAQFADELNSVLYAFSPIADETGIIGRYDMTINFTPPAAIRDPGLPAATDDPVAPEPDGTISIFEALSKQLGLKLQPRKVKVAVLVVDHVNDTPAGN